MGLVIYNSLSNKLEEFKPNNGNKVNMYVCGPTVYNYIHIGNARPVIFYDMLKRYLEFLGYDVHTHLILQMLMIKSLIKQSKIIRLKR